MKLNPLFSDRAVLQSGITIPVWGTTTPDTAVTAEIAGKSARTLSNHNGNFIVRLPALPPGGPHTLTVCSGDAARRRRAAGSPLQTVVRDIFIGEVWLASGQSNMEWTVVQAFPDPDPREDDLIRMTTVPRVATRGRVSEVPADWRPATFADIPSFSAVAYFFARKLRAASGLPVGIIHSSWGGTPAESWTSREALMLNPETAGPVKSYEADLADDQFWDAPGAETRLLPGNPWAPHSLFDGMIAPLVPYALRGAIWYQGESNAGNAANYRATISNMITDWRRAWGQGDFPFIQTQLANFTGQPECDPNSTWPALREAQLQAARSLPNAGMAVAIDIGDALDIHPKNKRDVGFRLAQWALAKVYGHAVAPSGPVYESYGIEGGKIRVRFAGGTDNLAPVSTDVKTLLVAGADRRFVPAQSRVDGNTLLVWSDAVPAPRAVRYAWADNPEGANLYNAEGFPASPFRTDTW